MKYQHALAVLIVTLLSAAAPLQAKELYPAVQLVAMKAHATSEKHGDELYFHVTSYPSSGSPSAYRIPKFPMHWLSDYLDKIKQVELWSQPLKPGHSITLVMSLIEEDAPPWNTDDLVGTVRLHLKNKQGKLLSSWSIPNRADAPTQITTKYGTAQKFELLGEDSNYDVYLKLTQSHRQARP